MNTKSYILLIIFTTEALSQHGVSDQTFNQIEYALHSALGPAYSLQIVFSVDSESVYNLGVFGARLDKSDASLKGAYIFNAVGDTIDHFTAHKGCMGVYRNNQLVWLSDTVINDNEARETTIEAVMDLNADGTMEIVSCWRCPDKGGPDYLWIFSWDGHTGKLISDTDRDGQ